MDGEPELQVNERGRVRWALTHVRVRHQTRDRLAALAGWVRQRRLDGTPGEWTRGRDAVTLDEVIVRLLDESDAHRRRGRESGRRRREARKAAKTT